MMTRKYLFFCALPLFVLLTLQTQAQSTNLTPDHEERHALMITGRSTGASIKLRWAPTSPLVWKRCNEAGYQVVRHTLMRNNQVVSWEERAVATPLTPTPIFPWKTEAQWKPLMQRNQYAAICAQALLGESFEVEAGESSKALVNQATEENNRFTFGLFAADHSYEAAMAMGLAFEDKTVKSNETYLYRVYPAKQVVAPLDTLVMDGGKKIPVDLRNSIDTGFFSISTKDKFPLPKVREVEASFGNRVATVSWNKKLFEQFYVSYRVERSDDGVSWQELRDLPFVSLDRPGAPSDYMFMVDSLPMNGRPYFYRVAGRTVFDDHGPSSDPVQGMGIEPLPDYFPYIVSVLENERSHFIVGWNFNAAEESKIAGFKITRARADKGPYTVISGEALLPPSTRSFTDESPLSINYYRVAAYDQYNREMPSFSAMAQLNDETPPAAPVNVRGAILKDGSMVITWDKNKDPDLSGYRVYMANNPKDEFTQITRRAVSDNHFIDTVSLNTLSREVYVQVLALDYRQNASAFSKMAVVVRPDTIPPAAPAFKDLISDAKGITLVWANSQSRDVLRHEIMRRPKSGSTWEKVAEFPMTAEKISKFIDSTGMVGQDYVYQVAAVDNSDLKGLSQTVEGRILDNFVRPQIGAVSIEADRRNKLVTLQWDYAEKEKVRLFEIYRAAGTEPLNRYRAFTPEELAVETTTKTSSKKARKGFSYQAQDKDLRMNTDYTYRVRAIYHDGALSPLSEPVKVNY